MSFQSKERSSETSVNNTEALGITRQEKNIFQSTIIKV